MSRNVVELRASQAKSILDSPIMGASKKDIEQALYGAMLEAPDEKSREKVHSIMVAADMFYKILQQYITSGDAKQAVEDFLHGDDPVV